MVKVVGQQDQHGVHITEGLSVIGEITHTSTSEGKSVSSDLAGDVASSCFKGIGYPRDLHTIPQVTERVHMEWRDPTAAYYSHPMFQAMTPPGYRSIIVLS